MEGSRQGLEISQKTLWADRTAVDQPGDKFQSAP
jgi:hypothetical protein